MWRALDRRLNILPYPPYFALKSRHGSRLLRLNCDEEAVRTRPPAC